MTDHDHSGKRRGGATTFKVLYEIAVAVSGILEPERLAQLAVQRAQFLTGADASSLFWWVPERELLVPVAQHPSTSNFPERAHGRGEGVIGLAFAIGETHTGRDWTRLRRNSSAPTERVTSVLAVPLVVDARTEGVVCVRGSESTRWRQRQVEVLSLLASLVAPAFAAARRHADLAASEESFRAVYSDAHDQLLVLVRELSIHRTDPTPKGETISMSEAQALVELDTGAELTQGALAARLRLEKSTVSRLAAQMEARGWLKRTRDAVDARLVRVRLTARGKSIARDLAARRASRLQGLLQSVPDADRESFLEALKIVVQAL
jgi:DNA-binding MarR family transcriptional regulator